MPHTLKDVLPATARLRDDGHLEVGGCDLVSLAAEHGTPMYVFCTETFRRQARRYRAAFPTPDRVYYAAKAFTSIAAFRMATEEGLGVDVASGGELFAAMQAGVPRDDIIVHGNNKSDAELEMAVGAGVGRVAVDSIDELERLARVAEAAGVRQTIVLRVTPGVEAHTHEYIQTGQEDTKFGMSIESGAALEAAKRAADLASVSLVGAHAHIGSQIFGSEAFGKLVEIMCEFLADVRDATGRTLGELNVGGGLGIAYTKEEAPADVGAHAAFVREVVTREAARHELPPPVLSVEPGRSIVGNAMLTLYTVGVVKDIPGVRTYVSVDGGMSDNIRPMLYGARYSALLANRANEASDRVVTVAGSHCESGDVLLRDIALPSSVGRGDLLAVLATGAYGYAMSSNYNKMRRPPVVAVADGLSRVVVRRESYDDLVRLDQP
ncbi:MAG: diaminopimelate decarboxylase [Actinobacteria bacterium]|nr:MAG: diaminopimelate decarboxylase [Actinomycetota bacterium]